MMKVVFDQGTKTKLQKFVSEARILLSNEFIRQLQNEFGIDPNTGLISEVSKLKHLDDTRRQTSRLIRDTIEHYITSSSNSDTLEAIDRIVREQAFTILNRICAIRMAEARGMIIESIGNGYNSKGFQLYTRLSGTSLGERGDTYKNFIYSLFDEFANDLPVFFDRYSSMGRLFPRESVLLELLNLINDEEIVNLWTEDETIGWIYQYFNSIEERRQFRAESRMPRNSRELAVRNQFFTPRYVVEYLTDNTLGRIWFEMTQGETSILDECSYLVKQPNVVFLKKGEDRPIMDNSSEHISQEELLIKTHYIPYRQLKDPREITLLDPACGSMHFGLYAFDLFIKIYKEAWDIEELGGKNTLKRTSEILPLTDTYDNRDSFIQDIPRLIIENNIHGIDIDQRAVQIAGLSLWLRAQRCWQEHEIRINNRPQIRKSNIVCAEPMPGENVILKEFTSTLRPRVLSQMVENIFEKMELAGEAGVLLKIEEEIQERVEFAREEFNKELLKRGTSEQTELFEDENKVVQTSLFDFTDLPNQTQFWATAEQKILNSLQSYAESFENKGSTLRRLFADDAAKGFSFIDISKKKFDVIVMNPPFGEASKRLESYLSSKYTDWAKNILCAFIIRMKELNPEGLIGAIFDRTASIKSSYKAFRTSHLNEYLISVADTGWDVLDANVETTAHVFSANKNKVHASFFDVRNIEASLKKDTLYQQVKNFKRGSLSSDVYLINPSLLLKLPNAVVGYYFDEFLLWMFSELDNLGESELQARVGHQLVSKEHVRLFWEVKEINRTLFSPFYNGAEFSLFSIPFRDVTLLGEDDELVKHNKSVVLRNQEYQLKMGVGYGKRGEILDAHFLPGGYIFSVEGQAITGISQKDSYLLLSFLNSSLAQYTINLYCGQHKHCGYVNLIPLPNVSNDQQLEIIENAKNIIDIKSKWFSYDETTKEYDFSKFLNQNISVRDFTNELRLSYEKDYIELIQRILENDKAFLNSTIISQKQIEKINNYIKQKRPIDSPWPDFERDKGVGDFDNFITKCIISMLIGCTFGRWEISEVIKLSDPTLSNKIIENRKYAILTNDSGSRYNIQTKVKEIMHAIWSNDEEVEKELCYALGISSLKEYFNNLSMFFADHLKRYTKSRRQAPIYWPLSTENQKFTVWLCYSNLSDQTLYSCVNDIIDPKIKQVKDNLSALRSKSNRTVQDDKEVEEYLELELELKTFRDEILNIAKFWKPNFIDGVQILAAPFWKLVAYKPWQKTLKETWESLENGDFDWSHLAYKIWPDRIRQKCKMDQSLAVVHGLEDLYEEPTLKSRRKKA
jgi:hypothetical protein